jgi:ABC-2 type transport system permease protein
VRALRFLLRKEFRQIFRDRMMVAQMIVMPIVQLLILSNAATFTVRSSDMFVVDHDRTPAARGVVDRLVASGRFMVAGYSYSMDVADEAMLARRASMIVRIPPGFERDLVRGDEATVQLVLNAEDGAAAGIAGGYARAILDRYGAELAATDGRALRAAALRPEGMSAPSVQVSTRSWYNPELDYRDYVVPGILVVLVTAIGTVLTAVNITREKELGTLDQLNVTPVTRMQFIAGKLIPLWAIGLLELSLGLTVARLVFDVPMEGNLLLVFLTAAIYLIAALGIGLLVSTIAETQQQAMFVSFFVLMIYLLMSGLFTPVRSMPEWAQWLAQLNPVMHCVAIMRAILLKGAGFAEIARPLLVLVGFAAVFFGLAVRQYAKRAA